MKARKARLLKLLEKSPQLMVPIYQRAYSWGEDECKQLWRDIVWAGEEETKTYFVGSIVYIEESLSQVSQRSPLLVIDGQQRLTTVTLLLAALANALEDAEPIEGFSAQRIRDAYLYNVADMGERKYKLVLSQNDKETLFSVVDKAGLPSDHSIRIASNFSLFEWLINSCNGDYYTVCKGLKKLVVVDVALKRGKDNPQLIFESMNSKGLDLSQADLIRNFILMGLEPRRQARLHEKYWRAMERNFGQEAYSESFDGFMRHYLTMKTGRIPKKSEVYLAFKEFRMADKSDDDVDSLMEEIRRFARYYCSMALGMEPTPKLRRAFYFLGKLRADPAYPFLLELYHDYDEGRLSRDDMSECVRLVEAYILRRFILKIPSNSMNKTFPAFMKALNKDCYLESVRNHFASLTADRRFPRDDEFKEAMIEEKLYERSNKLTSYVLCRMENQARKEPIDVDHYTIEHIMPQNKNLSGPWRYVLGPDWKRIHELYLHKLCNLTLTGYNSEFGDKSFKEKRDMVGGFKHSPLRLNEGLGRIDRWDKDEMDRRGERLAKLALDGWIAPPQLPEKTLQTHRDITSRGSNCIQDYPYLDGTELGRLFDAFRREVLALDPSCVTEHYQKYYIAYRREKRNFVDAKPQAKLLQLYLNMPFSKIKDTRNLCRDVSKVGHLGNGDISLKFGDYEDLPYVMDLVRQAFKSQLK